MGRGMLIPYSRYAPYSQRIAPVQAQSTEFAGPSPPLMLAMGHSAQRGFAGYPANFCGNGPHKALIILRSVAHGLWMLPNISIKAAPQPMRVS